MIQLLAPLLAPALSSAAGAAGLTGLQGILANKVLGSALLSGVGSLLSGEDLQGALKSAAIGGAGGALLGGAGSGAAATKDVVTKAAQEEAAKGLARESLGEVIQNEGIAAALNQLTGKEGLLSPANMLLFSMFAPQPKAPKYEPYIGGGYYGPGMKYYSAESVLNRAEGGRIVGPGTPTSDSIPATIYQDGQPVGEAALSTQEVVLSHKDLAAMDPDGDYERASEIIGNAKNGDRAKMAAELYLKMRKA